MTDQRLESLHFPYVPLSLRVGSMPDSERRYELEVLLDTGFDGDVGVPVNSLTYAHPPDAYLTWALADGSEVAAPAHLGHVWLGEIGPIEVVITALGDEPIVGRHVTDRFNIVLDHGRRVIVEP